MSANIDLSASKGTIPPYKHGVFMEYKLSPSLASQSPAAGFQPHASSESGRKMKGRDMRQRERDGERERSAGIGGRQTSKMKKGEGRRMKRMTMRREDEGRKKGK